MDVDALARTWEALPREAVRPGVSRAGFRGDRVLLVMNWLEPGLEVRPHSHPFEQVAYVVKGHMRFRVGDRVIDCGPGSVLRIPPDVEHFGEVVGDETVMNLDVFAPIRDDYRHLVTHQASDFPET